MSLKLFRQAVDGGWNPSIVAHLSDTEVHDIYTAHIAFGMRFGGQVHIEPAIRHELRGLDLMCWCSLDNRCHVDILLEIANR